jgi:hypothetical protein
MEKIQKLEKERQALQLENEVLRNFIDTSKDALFCIEFLELVDLTAPEPEIVRQMFENECVWRMCNNAMARLYKLPEGQDFNAQNVHFVFAHNPENEEFVRTLIKAEFNIDGVVSLDGDYDGHEVYMENDIRAVITDGMLHRMIGAVRNISERKKREQALTGHLPSYVLHGDSKNTVSANQFVSQHQQTSSEIQAAADSSRPLKEQVRAFERTLIDSAIDRLGSKRKAARALGVDIGTIVRKTQGEKSV